MGDIITIAKKAIGAVVAFAGALIVLVGVVLIVTIVGIIPGILAVVGGTVLFGIGMSIGWQKEYDAFNLKRNAEQKARKMLQDQAIEKEAQTILAEKAGE